MKTERTLRVHGIYYFSTMCSPIQQLYYTTSLYLISIEASIVYMPWWNLYRWLCLTYILVK